MAARQERHRKGNAKDLYEVIKTSIHIAAEEVLSRLDSQLRKRPECLIERKGKVDPKKCAYRNWLNINDSEDRKLYARLNIEVKVRGL